MYHPKHRALPPTTALPPLQKKTDVVSTPSQQTKTPAMNTPRWQAGGSAISMPLTFVLMCFPLPAPCRMSSGLHPRRHRRRRPSVQDGPRPLPRAHHDRSGGGQDRPGEYGSRGNVLSGLRESERRSRLENTCHAGTRWGRGAIRGDSTVRPVRGRSSGCESLRG